jgi:hypothetical protein
MGLKKPLRLAWIQAAGAIRAAGGCDIDNRPPLQAGYIVSASRSRASAGVLAPVDA